MKWTVYFLLFITLGALFLSTHVHVKAQDDGAGAHDDDDGEDAQANVPPHTAGGDDDDEASDEAAAEAEDAEEVELKPSNEVVTAVYFPDWPEKKIPVGEKITMLVVFHNNGPSEFNITNIRAHLHSPFDFSYYIQNFTSREVGAIVLAGQEVSVEYTFLPDKSLEPLEFHLSAYLDYNDTNELRFRSTFQNGTIELVERASNFDAKLVFSYFLAASAAGLIAFIGMNLSKSLTASPKVERGTKHASNSTGSASSSDDWAGPIYKPKAAGAAIGRKRAPKSPKSPAATKA